MSAARTFRYLRASCGIRASLRDVGENASHQLRCENSFSRSMFLAEGFALAGTISFSATIFLRSSKQAVQSVHFAQGFGSVSNASHAAEHAIRKWYAVDAVQSQQLRMMFPRFSLC